MGSTRMCAWNLGTWEGELVLQLRQHSELLLVSASVLLLPNSGTAQVNRTDRRTFALWAIICPILAPKKPAFERMGATSLDQPCITWTSNIFVLFSNCVFACRVSGKVPVMDYKVDSCKVWEKLFFYFRADFLFYFHSETFAGKSTTQ